MWSPHRTIGQKLKSLCSRSFAFLYIPTACAYMPAMQERERYHHRERYPCALWMPGPGLPWPTETPPVSPLEVWIQHLPRKQDQPLVKAGCWQLRPSISILGLASLSGFTASWHSPAHFPTTEFASPLKPSGQIAMASANLKSCVWETMCCHVPSLSQTLSTPKGMLSPWPQPCLVCCRGHAPSAVAQPPFMPRLQGCKATAKAPPALSWGQQLCRRVPDAGKPTA